MTTKLTLSAWLPKMPLKPGSTPVTSLKQRRQAAGGNGGDADMAQAGGKNPSALQNALEKGKETILSMVK